MPCPQREELVFTQRNSREEQESSRSSAPCVLPSPSCPGAAAPGGFPATDCGGHKQLQGKDSKLQRPDKISVIPVEVFLLCSCTVLIKAGTFRHND